MKIYPRFTAFNVSSKGMGVQKIKMDLIAENLANTSTTKTEDGTAYKRKTLSISEKKNYMNEVFGEGSLLKMNKTNPNHINDNLGFEQKGSAYTKELDTDIVKDTTEGEKVYMPDHPDADEEGYVMMPNVNVVTEMVDMIAATRSFEANLTAFNAAKQIAKDSLEI